MKRLISLIVLLFASHQGMAYDEQDAWCSLGAIYGIYDTKSNSVGECEQTKDVTSNKRIDTWYAVNALTSNDFAVIKNRWGWDNLDIFWAALETAEVAYCNAYASLTNAHTHLSNASTKQGQANTYYVNMNWDSCISKVAEESSDLDLCQIALDYANTQFAIASSKYNQVNNWIVFP